MASIDIRVKDDSEIDTIIFAGGVQVGGGYSCQT